MSDTFGERGRDLRPGLIVCAYESPQANWDLVEDLSGTIWNPPGARIIQIPGGLPAQLAPLLAEELAVPGCRGVLLVGHNHSGAGFRLQLRAENRGLDGQDRADRTGPGLARATVPAAEILRALGAEGLRAEATSESEDDVGTYLLYRLLAGVPDNVMTPSIGLLRVPLGASSDQIRQAVKAAASAIARGLAPLPRHAVA